MSNQANQTNLGAGQHIVVFRSFRLGSLHVYWILIAVLCVCVFIHRLHGTPRNPYNVNHYTGGSSSGSAAAVAAGKNVKCGL